MIPYGVNSESALYVIHINTNLVSGDLHDVAAKYRFVETTANINF